MNLYVGLLNPWMVLRISYPFANVFLDIDINPWQYLTMNFTTSAY